MFVGITHTEKIFSMNRWDSVNALTSFCERLDLAHLYAQRNLVFYTEK